MARLWLSNIFKNTITQPLLIESCEWMRPTFLLLHCYYYMVILSNFCDHCAATLPVALVSAGCQHEVPARTRPQTAHQEESTRKLWPRPPQLLRRCGLPVRVCRHLPGRALLQRGPGRRQQQRGIWIPDKLDMNNDFVTIKSRDMWRCVEICIRTNAMNSVPF